MLKHRRGLTIRRRRPGIAHLAGSMPWPPSAEPPVQAAGRSLGSLFKPSGGETHQAWLDITPLREDTGYESAWDLERAYADYVAWLRAGSER